MTSRELAGSICSQLHEAGFRAYFVGGCVRDLILGREAEDWDVTTNATPDQVRQLFPNSLAVGAQFGVIVVVEDELQVEVATFRSDIGYSDGRHPDRVTYSNSPEEDVRRRDFTINALLLNPRTNEILDFVGGRQDLRAGIIRAIGNPDERFREDKLRMLRGIRFAARFGYQIEPETWWAIQRLADRIVEVSAERIRDELTRMLTEGNAKRAFEMLDESGLLHILLPEVEAMKGVEQPPQYHPEGDVWIHTRLMLQGLPQGCSPTLAWGVLLHDVGKPPTFRPASETGDRIRFDNHAVVGTRMSEEICKRLRFSNDDREQVAALVANHMKFKDVLLMRPSTLKKFVRLDRFEPEHMVLHRLDCLSSHRHLDNYDFLRKFLQETPPDEVHPERVLTGDDLKGLGLKPGPLFRQILERVEEAQLEGRLRTREEAVAFVKAHFSSELRAC